ncbi:hypothetical protein Aduo_001654 [Ancylostoma duodenale]
MAELVMYDGRLEVNAFNTRMQELRRHAERLEERAENERIRRKEEHEMFVEKTARDQVGCIGRTASDREAQTGKSLAGQGFGPPEVGDLSIASRSD